MSIECDIFVDTTESVEEFGRQIEQILGLTLECDIAKAKLNPEFYVYYYSAPDDQYWLGVIILDEGYFADQGDMLFSTYNYQIPISTFDHDPNERLEHGKEITLTIFDRLKASGRYRLLAVHDMAIRLAQYDPPAAPK